jgi:glycosyltransferase involved in cell wall biosynthesis
LEKSCIFTGLRHDMPELYALMSVFVLPTHRESFPRAAIESLAMGVPCVLTNIPGCREVVEHDRNGWLVPVNDVPALVGAIIKLLTDPGQARRLGEAGQRIARERFDERLIFARVKAEYARLLRAKGLSVPAVQPEIVVA